MVGFNLNAGQKRLFLLPILISKCPELPNFKDAYSPLLPCPWAHEACGTLHQQMLLWRLVCSLPNEPEHEPPILCRVLDSLKVIST